VEISAEPPASYPGAGSIHILGYGMRLDDPELNGTLEKLQDARKDRNPQIIARLNKLGIALGLEELEREAGDGQPGRPHIAKLLVRKGIVRTIDEAFDRYLGNGKPAYVDKFRIESSQAIELINGAGGIPVLAHPCLLELESDQQLDEILREMMSMGLKGLEVYFSEHSPEQTRRYAELAQRCDLLMTGGTDFHGAFNRTSRWGRQRRLACPLRAVRETDRELTRHRRPAAFARISREEELPMGRPPVSPVETLIHYTFEDRRLLEEALRHSSFVNEVPDAGLRDNERLEFLGDAVLNLVVGHILLMRFAVLKEGDLSRMRANLVNEQQLAQLARGLCLGTAVKLGRGEAQSGGMKRIPSWPARWRR